MYFWSCCSSFMTRNEYRLATSLDSFTFPAYRPENTSGSAGAGGAGAAGACAAGAPAGSVTDSAAGRFASNGLLGDGGAPFSAGASFSAGAVAAAAGAHAGAPRLKFPGTNSDTAAAATSAGLGLVGLGFAPFAGLGFGLLSAFVCRARPCHGAHYTSACTPRLRCPARENSRIETARAPAPAQ